MRWKECIYIYIYNNFVHKSIFGMLECFCLEWTSSYQVDELSKKSNVCILNGAFWEIMSVCQHFLYLLFLPSPIYHIYDHSRIYKYYLYDYWCSKFLIWFVALDKSIRHVWIYTDEPKHSVCVCVCVCECVMLPVFQACLWFMFFLSLEQCCEWH